MEVIETQTKTEVGRSGWNWSDQVDLDPKEIHLLLPRECWNYRCGHPAHPEIFIFINRSTTLTFGAGDWIQGLCPSVIINASPPGSSFWAFQENPGFLQRTRMSTRWLADLHVTYIWFTTYFVCLFTVLLKSLQVWLFVSRVPQVDQAGPELTELHVYHFLVAEFLKSGCEHRHNSSKEGNEIILCFNRLSASLGKVMLYWPFSAQFLLYWHYGWADLLLFLRTGYDL